MRRLARALLEKMPMRDVAFSVLSRSRLLPESVYQHLYFEGPITVRLDAKHQFKMQHWGCQIENDIHWSGFGNNWEATTLRLWLRLARAADVILDIGANTGVFALSAKAVNRRARVFAFEPVDRVFRRLKYNIELNAYDITAVKAGASDANGTAILFDVPTAHVYSASLEREMLGDRPDLVSVSVEIVRAGEFLQENVPEGAILAKIDTERHEPQVLDGFGHLIASRRPIFVVEVLDGAIGNLVEKRFQKLDYVFYEVVERHAVLRTQHLDGRGSNFLICPREVTERLNLGEEISHQDLDPRRYSPDDRAA
jgi:FkbM family methyltransferase